MASQFTSNLLTPNLLRSKNDTHLMSLTLKELYLKKAEAVDVEDYDTAKHIKGVIEKKNEDTMKLAATLPPPGAPLAYWTSEVHNQMETAYTKFIDLAIAAPGTFNEEFLYPLLDEGLSGLLEHFASPFEAMLGVIMTYIQVKHYGEGYYDGALPWPCFLKKLLEFGAGEEMGSWPLARLVYQQIARARSGADMLSLMKGRAGRYALTMQVAAAYNDLTVTPEDKMVLLREYSDEFTHEGETLFKMADEDGVEAELEEFTHEGQTLFKMADEENEGCFLILNRSPGGEEDEYEQWGTMDADGNISKDDE